MKITLSDYIAGVNIGIGYAEPYVTVSYSGKTCGFWAHLKMYICQSQKELGPNSI